LRRISFIEDLFGGLNYVYQAHHKVGALAFALLLLHPFLLAIRFMPENSSAAFALLYPYDISTLMAWLSLLIMFLFLVYTLFIRIKYHHWHVLHLLSGLAFIFAILHVFTVSSDVSVNPWLAGYIAIICAGGLIAFLIRLSSYVIGVKRYQYQVINVTKLSKKVVEIELKAVGPKLEFNAGQFVYVNFYDPHEAEPNTESHPFSIASSTTDKNIKLVIKNLGDRTKDLQKLCHKAIAYLEGPYGRFSFRNTANRKQVWIAGGIGITPFLSMLRSLTPKDKKYEIDFYYCTETKKDALFLGELKKIAKRFPKIRVNSHCDKEQGFISAQIIAQQVSKVAERDILISGPPQMQQSLKNQFTDIGVAAKNIYIEEFNFD
jgi:predicted ferric reductase